MFLIQLAFINLRERKHEQYRTQVRPVPVRTKNNPSAQPEHDIPKMLKEIISSRFYEADYNSITIKLLYENISYSEAIANGIAKVADLDLFAYRPSKNGQ